MNQLTCLALLALVALSQVHAASHVSRKVVSKDLAADIEVALTATIAFTGDKDALRASVATFQTSYAEQAGVIAGVQQQLADLGVPQADLDALQVQVSAADATAQAKFVDVESKLSFLDGLLVDITWDLENNYLDDLYLDLDYLRTNLENTNAALTTAYSEIETEAHGINDAVLALIEGDTSSSAEEVRASLAGVLSTFHASSGLVQASLASFNTSGAECAATVQVVVDQV